MRRKKRNTRRRDDQKDAVGGSFSFTRRGLRGGFWFLLSLLFATSAFALVPSSSPTAKEKNEETSSPFTILRAEKWPNGGLRIFYSSPEKEQSDEGENAAGKNTAVELSFQKEKEEEEKKIILESTKVIATKPSSSPLPSFYSGTTTIVLAPSDGILTQSMVSGLARLIWSKDIPDSEKIAIFALRLTPPSWSSTTRRTTKFTFCSD